MEAIPGPTELMVDYYINQISHISDSEQSVQADLYVSVQWQDIRLQFLPAPPTTSDFHEMKIWYPKLDLVYATDCSIDSDRFQVDGCVVRRWYRMRCKVSIALDLKLFPCDSQNLSIRFESGDYESNLLKISCYYDEKVRCSSRVTDIDKQGEWRFVGMYHTASTFVWEYDNLEYSVFQVDIILHRQTGFYMKKIGLIVALIWMMNWSIFFCDTSDIGNRLQVSITLALTAVAFQFVVIDTLPRVSYHTLIDKYMIVCFVTIASTVLESCVVFVGRKRKWSHSTIEAIDDLSLIVSIVFFIFFTFRSFMKVAVSHIHADNSYAKIKVNNMEQ